MLRVELSSLPQRSTRSLSPLLASRLMGILVAGLREILAHRVPYELVPHIDPPQVGMAGKLHTVEVESLALLEVSPRPFAGQARYNRPLARQAHPHSLRTTAREIEEVIDHFDQPVEDIVDGGDVGQKRIAVAVAQIGRDVR